jgi:C-terminal processing protease CtpA/Prc
VRDCDAVGAGMALGDTIVTINGRPVTDYSWEEEYNIDEQAKHILEIIGADSQKKQITLEAKLRW